MCHRLRQDSLSIVAVEHRDRACVGVVSQGIEYRLEYVASARYGPDPRSNYLPWPAAKDVPGRCLSGFVPSAMTIGDIGTSPARVGEEGLSMVAQVGLEPWRVLVSSRPMDRKGNGVAAWLNEPPRPTKASRHPQLDRPRPRGCHSSSPMGICLVHKLQRGVGVVQRPAMPVC